MNKVDLPPEHEIQNNVRAALTEDLGNGDLGAALFAATTRANARLLCRQPATLCGQAWFNGCFQALDPDCQIRWQVMDGETIAANEVLCELTARVAALLSAERSALNFIQTLSATATTTAQWSRVLSGTRLELLDTRKTLPGLRQAQKYAVRCGGGKNHRLGLYDQCLLKENHLAILGGVAVALAHSRDCGIAAIEIEVENLDQFTQALTAGATHILLDNMSLDDLQKAVEINAGKAVLEVSGNIQIADLPRLAKIGVNYVSVGALTKHIQAIDFSLQVYSYEDSK